MTGRYSGMPQARRVRRNAKLVIGYLRVSTDFDRQDLGGAAQKADIERYAERHGLTIVAWHADAITGSSALADRKGLSAALADVSTLNAGRVVFQKWDRFGRADQLDSALAERAFKDAGARLMSADGIGAGDSPEAELMKAQIQAFARYERAKIAARIKSALAQKQARGEMTGKARFGYQLAADGRHVEPNVAEQTIIARVHELRAAGHTIRSIAEELAVEGFVGRAGKPLTRDAVHVITKTGAAVAAA